MAPPPQPCKSTSFLLCPSPHSLFSNKRRPTHHHNTSNLHWKPTTTTGGCSFQRQSCVCSIKKPRVRKKVKSNVELCNEIQEFVSSVGLPEGHVPSFKELCDHGRTDLAHVVRRRGYKLLRDLLSNSKEAEGDGSNIENSLAGRPHMVDDDSDSSTGQDGEENDMNVDFSSSLKSSSSSDQLENTLINMEQNPSNYTSTPVESAVDLSFEEKELNRIDLQDGNDKSEDSSQLIPLKDMEQDNEGHEKAEDDSLQTPLHNKEDSEKQVEDNGSCISVESSGSSALKKKPKKLNGLRLDHGRVLKESTTNLSFEEKAAKFIQSGELENFDDDVNDIISKSSINERKGLGEQANMGENEPYTSQETLENKVSSANATMMLNGSASKKAMASSLSETVSPSSSNLDKDLETENCERENQIQINQLKFMLHQKELELSRLKELVENEKLALSDLAAKAEIEIGKTKKLVSDKDAELIAAEESLSGLTEVEIQYSGEGEIVEVAGSFNGWDHHIKMDPQSSSSTIDNAGSRKSRRWSTILWLYPGVYETKFIVDGNWTIDPQRESVANGGISNNILRVNG